MKYDVLLLAGIIKNRRITLGYSLRSLAEQVGISHTELARIENGNRTNFSLIVIVRLCEILKIDFVNLLKVTGYISSNNKLDNDFEEDYKDSNDESDDEDYEYYDDYEYDDKELDDIIDFDFNVEVSPNGDEMCITIKLMND